MNNEVKVNTGGGALSMDHSNLGIGNTLIHSENASPELQAKLEALFTSIAEAERTSGTDLSGLKRVAEPLRSPEAQSKSKDWWSAKLESIEELATSAAPTIGPLLGAITAIKSFFGL